MFKTCVRPFMYSEISRNGSDEIIISNCNLCVPEVISNELQLPIATLSTNDRAAFGVSPSLIRIVVFNLMSPTDVLISTVVVISM